MTLSLSFAVGGISGLSGIMIVVGYLFYETSLLFSVVLLSVGIPLGVAIASVGLYTMYTDAESRKKEAEARAKWAPFTYGNQ